jgi:hypothetical protein
MSKSNFSDDFKRDAVAQITEGGLSGFGGFTAAGGQPAFALRVGEEVLCAVRWR